MAKNKSEFNFDQAPDEQHKLNMDLGATVIRDQYSSIKERVRGTRRASISVTTSTVMISLIVAIAFLSAPGASLATPVVHDPLAKVDIATGAAFVAVPKPTATYTMKTFSEVAGAQNLVTTDTIVPPAAKKLNQIILLGAGAAGARAYGPKVWGVNGVPKPTGSGAITSTTSVPTVGTATAIASYTVAAGANPAKILLTANGGTNSGFEEAAAEGRDPFDLPPGQYDYPFSIDEITLMTSGQQDFAGVSVFATDSRFTDPLWSLYVFADGPVASAADLQIFFQSQSVLTQGGLPLDNAQIADNVRNAFSVSGGIASLTSFQLFDSSYSVDRTISFEEGAVAGEQEAVPEPPSTIVLLGLGGLCLMGLRWLSRGR